MNIKNPAIRAVLIFTFIMGIISLLVMLAINLKSVSDSTNAEILIDPATLELVQLEAPNEGDKIAIVDTTLGEFRFVLYPQYCPKTVANFIELAESGCYNDTYVYNVVNGILAESGACDLDGNIRDKSHEKNKRELHQNLWPFKGAVCVQNTEITRTFKQKIFGGGTYLNGSRFTLVNSIEFDEEIIKELKEASDFQLIADAFIENGGIPNYSQQLTVIGQTYEGIEVVEAITNTETTDSGHYNVPKEEIKINSIVISEYSAENNDNAE